MHPGENEHDLASRHRSEEEFHDQKYATEEFGPALYELYPTSRIFDRMKVMFGDLRDRRVLEYGCGEGWVTAELAALGAVVDAFDISSKSVERTRDLLARHRLDARCTLKKSSAESLDYPDATFDIVVGFAILHHLNLELALPEMLRVMKPGATAYFAEPLGTNPLINAYRRRTPQYRTPDERPLDLDEFQREAKAFRGFRHEEFYLTALAPLVAGGFRPLRKVANAAIGPFMAVDRAILRVAPWAGRWAWYSVVAMTK